MITLQARIKMFRGDFAGMQRDFNRLLVSVLLDLGYWWIEHKLPIHFTASGAGRYRYPTHTRKFLALKQAIGSPEPFVFSGELRDYAIARANPKATATRNRSRLIVAIPIPHPIRPKWRGQLGKLSRGDLRELHQLGTRWMEQRLPEAALLAKRATTVGKK
jgi:hypothetical protein